MLMKRKSDRNRIMALARVMMAVVLSVGYSTSMWGQTTVSSYLTEDKPLQYCIDHGMMQQGPYATVTWNPELKAAFFKGGANGPMTGSHPYLALIDKPFKNVDPSTGFTISMEFKTYAAANKVSYDGVYGIGTYQWSRLIEANIGSVGAIRGGGFQKYFCIMTCGSVAANGSNYNAGDQYHLGNEFASPCGNTSSTYIASNNGVTNKCKARNLTSGNRTYWADKNNDESFHAISLVVKPGSGNSSPTVTTYIDGVVWNTTTSIGESGGSLTYAQIVNDVLTNINSFDNILIGRSGFEADGDFCGYIRNIQIVSSGYTSTIKFSTAPSHGTVSAAVSGASSGMKVTTGGVILPKQTPITLSALPDVGYYMTSITYDGTTVNDVPSTQFTTSGDIHQISATFAERVCTVKYDSNNGVKIGDNTIYEPVEGMPSNPTETYKYFTDAFTFDTALPTRKGYTFLGWSTDKNATTATYAAADCASSKTLAAAAEGATTSDKGIFSSAADDNNVITLYAVWQKNDYLLTTTVKTQDYTGVETASAEDLNGTGGSVSYKRARQITPETSTSLTSPYNAQYEDKVQVITTPSQDYFLAALTYAYNDGTEHTETFDVGNGYNVSKTFTMPAAAVSVTATFKHEHEYIISNAIEQNEGAGNSVSFTRSHNSGAYASNLVDGMDVAMQNDQVKLTATIANDYILRKVTYKVEGDDTEHSVFDGKTKGTSGTFTTDAFTMPGNPITVTATFLKDRAVKVETVSDNRGTFTFTGYNSTTNTDNGNLTAHQGDAITVTVVPKTGWHFDISNNASATERLVPEEVTATASTLSKTQAVITFTMPDADVPVIGKFTENTYTISYHANGGDGAPAGQKKAHFSSLTLTKDKPTLASNTFLGWAKSSTASTPEFAAGETVGDALNVDSENAALDDGGILTLYAVWESTKYAVNIDPGINGGQVRVDKNAAKKDEQVTISYVADEGYESTPPTFYWYSKGSTDKKESGALSGTTFTMPDHDVYVYATFKGLNAVSKDEKTVKNINNQSTVILNGVISVGGVNVEDIAGMAEDEKPTVGSSVNTVAKPNSGYRLNQITWQKVSKGDMKAPHRAAGDTDVEVEGLQTLTLASDNVTYDRDLGEYVAHITGLTGDIYLAGSFKPKDALPADKVTIEGPKFQQWRDEDEDGQGDAITPGLDEYTVKIDGEVQTDCTLSWSQNTDENDQADVEITVGPNHEQYTGSVTVNDVFTIVKAPDATHGTFTANYDTDYTYNGTAQELTNLVVYRDKDGEKTTLSTTSAPNSYTYSVDYTNANHVNAGTATAKIQITYYDNESVSSDLGTVVCTYTIKPRPVTVTAKEQTVVYGDAIATTAGQANVTSTLSPALVNSDALASATFFTANKDVTDAGIITVSDAKIKNGTTDVTSNYSITYGTGTLTITQRPLTITTKDRTLEYGDAVPDVADMGSWYTVGNIAYNEPLSTVMTAGPTDYTFVKKSDSSTATLEQGTPVGEYTMTFSGAAASSNYSVGTYTGGTITVAPYDLRQATVVVEGAEQPYDGTPKAPTSVVVKKGGAEGWTVPEGDYVVKYNNADSHTESGTYTITAEAKENATTGTTNVENTATAETAMVIGKYALDGDKVTATIAAQTFTGSQIRPTAFETLKMNGTNIENTDYTIISYGANVNAGTGAGSVVIRATESSVKFTGTRTVTFDITAANLSNRTANVEWGEAVMVGTDTDTHRLQKSGNTVTTSLNGQPLTLAPASLVVKLYLANGTTPNTVALQPSDYTIAFKKGDGVVDAIPADAIGEYQVVVKGTTNATFDPSVTNTTNQYVTTDLKVNVTLPVTFANLKWSTYYDERFSLKLPTGFKAYYVTGISAATEGNNGTVNTSAEMDYIPAGVPVLLERPDGNTTTAFELDEASESSISGNDNRFIGVRSTSAGEVLTGDDAAVAYILMNNSFVRYEPGVIIGANRAYLKLTTGSGAPRKLDISIDGMATSVSEELRVESAAAPWYTLDGRKLQGEPTQKGVYIRNGKKVVIKK